MIVAHESTGQVRDAILLSCKRRAIGTTSVWCSCAEIWPMVRFSWGLKAGFTIGTYIGCKGSGSHHYFANIPRFLDPTTDDGSKGASELYSLS